jgi:hypothetical protein
LSNSVTFAVSRRALFHGDVAYVWHGGLRSAEAFDGLVASDLQIIWAKNNFAISRGDYHWKHEACCYAVRGKAFWSGDRKQTAKV